LSVVLFGLVAGISVVIALYNGAATIEDQLDALATQTYGDFEVVVADNGSMDGGVDVVRAHRVGALLVDASDRRGQGHARNVGAAAASGDKLLFCDQDDVADSHWVEAMAQALDRWDLVGGHTDCEKLNADVRGWREPLQRPDHVGVAFGCNLGVRRRAWEGAGGWPLGWHGGYEDVAFSWSVRNAGFTFGYASEAIMYYRYRTSLRAHMRQQYAYGRQSEVARRVLPDAELSPRVPAWRVIAGLVRHAPQLLHRRTAGMWFGKLARQAGVRASLLAEKRRRPALPETTD
jgi:GT2 family glycosyltransferase